MNNDEFIDFEVLMKQNKNVVNLISDGEIKMLLDSINEDDSENVPFDMYQIQGIYNTSKAYVKHVGKCGQRPAVKIGEFNFKNHTCRVVAYLLNDNDLEEIENNYCANVVSLHIIKGTKTKGIISLEFYTFQHLKNDVSIKALTSNNTQKNEIDGEFIFFWKTEQNNKIEKQILGTMNRFPKKKGLIYTLLRYLSHDSIKHIFNTNA